MKRLIGMTEHGQRRFFEPENFPWVRALEAHWPDIRTELDAVLQRVDRVPNFQDIQQEQRIITDDDRWKVFTFHAYGQRFEHNCRRCPKTTALLESIPGMTTAFFSILLPHKHVPAHTGPWKGVLRYHLALKTPRDETLCRIRVGQETRSWTLGKSLLFDDTYEHEVWNDSDEIRVVLFVDVIRQLPLPLALVNRAFIHAIGRSPFIQQAMERLERWEEQIAAKDAARADAGRFESLTQ